MQLSNFNRQRENNDGDCVKAQKSFQRATEHLSDAIVEGRHIIEGLRPALLDDLGLISALQELAETVADEMNCRLTFNANVDDERLPAAVEITAFRIVQEALNNSRKYSQSKTLQITIVKQSNKLKIVVQDWGIGFDTSCIHKERHCVGLTGMQERANLLGGECIVTSVSGQGTVVKAILPIKK
jgi:signal transduction histidine kinase